MAYGFFSPQRSTPDKDMKSYFKEMSLTLNKSYETDRLRFSAKPSNLWFVKHIYHPEWKTGTERDTDDVDMGNGVTFYFLTEDNYVTVAFMAWAFIDT